MDFSVIANNFSFLVVQGFLGVGGFVGGTLRLAIPAIVLGFLLGIFIGLARLARAPWIHVPATIYVEFFRGVPLVMVIFWIWFIIPQLLRMPIPEYGVALTAFVIFEAATAVGLRPPQVMRLVVLPQALRNMVPALVTQTIVLFKDTSLASIIGYVDLTKAAQIVNNREIRPFELYLFIAVVYWVCAYSMSRFARRYEQKLAHG